MPPDQEFGGAKAPPNARAARACRLLTSINEFSLNSPNSEPLAIAAGPGGKLWFADTGNSAIGVMKATTHVFSEFTAGLTPGSNPQGIVYDPNDGDIWFTEAGDPIGSPAIPSAIGMINPSTDQIMQFTTGLTPNSGPVGITLGKDGNLWFTEAGYATGGVPSAIGMINPTTHAITQFSSGLTAASNPIAISAGSDGNLWFVEQSADKIGMINPDDPCHFPILERVDRGNLSEQHHGRAGWKSLVRGHRKYEHACLERRGHDQSHNSRDH